MGRPDAAVTRRAWPWALALLPAVFVLVFHVRPVAEILTLGLAPEGHLDAGAAFAILGRPGIRRVIGFTAWQALLSTLLTLVVALPMAHLVATREFRGRRALQALLTVPFVLPTTVVGTAFLALLGPDSASLGAILLAHAFFNHAVVVRLVGAFWGGLDPDVTDAASTLGATGWQRLRHVSLPMSMPAIASAASVVFLFTFTSLGVILILGGPGLTTLEVEILRQTRNLLDLPAAAALVIVQLVAVLAALLVAGRLQQRAARVLPRGRAIASRRPIVTWRERGVLAANLAVAAALLVAPIVILVVRSFRVGGRWSMDAWTGLGDLHRGSLLAVSPQEALGNTVWFGIQATLLAVVLGTLASVVLSRSRTRAAGSFDALLALPLGTSAVTVGFGFLVALDQPPFDLRSSAALVPIAHAVVATPFVVRVLLPAMRALDPDLRLAARTLGASPVQALRQTDLRSLAGPLATAAAFSFAISAGEFGATVFIARPESTTAPLMILRLLSQPGAASLAQAMAVSVALLVLVTTVVLGAGLAETSLDRSRR